MLFYEEVSIVTHKKKLHSFDITNSNEMNKIFHVYKNIFYEEQIFKYFFKFCGVFVAR